MELRAGKGGHAGHVPPQWARGSRDKRRSWEKYESEDRDKYPTMVPRKEVFFFSSLQQVFFRFSLSSTLRSTFTFFFETAIQLNTFFRSQAQVDLYHF